MFPRSFLIFTAGLLAAAATLHAQTFTLANGTALQPLISVGSFDNVGGLEADSSGNVYYFDNSVLKERAADGTTTTLYSLSSSVYPSFIRINGSAIYFGESSNNQLYKATLGTKSLSGVTDFGTVQGNYDLTFNGSTAYLSANPGTSGTAAQVDVLNVSTGATSLKISDAGDYSGPVRFDPASGYLYYGTSGSVGSIPGAIYRFSAADLAGSTTLTLDAAHKFASNTGNAYLTSGAGLLYGDAFGKFAVTSYDSTGGSSILGSSDSASQPGLLAYAGNTLYVEVTNYNTGVTDIYAVPEPATAGLLGLGAFALGVRRRRR